MTGHKRIPVTLATGGTSTSGIKIQGWNGVAIQMPASFVVYVQGSHDDTTYQRLAHFTGVTATANYWVADYNATTGGNYMVECLPAAGLNYIKLEVGTAASVSYTAYVHVYKPA